MKKQMIIPDELVERVKEEAELQHMNFTQYTIRALARAVEGDTFLRTQPEIRAKLVELNDMMSHVKVD